MPKKARSEKFRFDLPAVINPEEDWCIVVKIPGHTDYLAALMGQLALLTRSENFARDDTLTGAAETAHRWKDALYSQPITRFTCEALMTDVRQNEDEPCTLEKTFDGGETWEAWADLQLCPPQIVMSSDGSLWWYNKTGIPGGPYGSHSGTGALEPIPTSGIPSTVPPAVPAPFPPGSPEYEDDTAPCVAAANITDQLRLGTGEIVSYASTAETVTLAGLAFIGTLIALTGIGAIVGIALNMLALLGTLELIALSADYDAISWDDIRDVLVCYIDAQGRLTEFNRLAFLADITDRLATSLPGNQAVPILLKIIEQVTAEGLTTAATVPSVLVAADCSPACLWEQEFDFKTGQHGWTIYSIYGEYVAGSGFGRVAYPNSDNIYIQNDVTGYQLHSVEFFISSAYGTASAPVEYILSFDQGTTYAGGSPGENPHEWSVGSVTIGDGLTCAFDPYNGANQNIEIYIEKLILRGTGDNPF